MSYFFIRIFSALVAILPYRFTYLLSFPIGSLVYYFASELRKTALSNLLISDLNLSPAEAKNIAKKSFQNLALTCLEYPHLSRYKGRFKWFSCLNPEAIDAISLPSKSAVYLSAHQANWEIPFIDLCTRYRSEAIGRPLKNPKLDAWIIRIRESTGGKIWPIQNAVKAARLALSEGRSFGMVGDQAFPDSSYAFTFLGQHAYGVSTPALLAYRHNVPIIPTLNRRSGMHQEISYLEPIYPDLSKPLKKEAKRMMDRAMQGIEDSIRQQPEDWMWQHNRFKRPTALKLLKKYRYETLLIIHPSDPELQKLFEDSFYIFHALYPQHNITHLVEKGRLEKLQLPKKTHGSLDILEYSDKESAIYSPLRHKLVFDFSGFQGLKKAYQNGAAITYVRPKELIGRILDRLHVRLTVHDLLTHFETYLMTALFEGDTLCPKTAFSILETSKKMKQSALKEKRLAISEA